MNIDFSVIVTVYNLGEYLDECLTSILSASSGYKVEVIVVNDGSSDMITQSVINDLEAKYTSIRFFHKSNGGPASARNFGIMHASGKFVIPFDADNTMRSCFFEIILSALTASSAFFDVYCYKAQFFGEKNEVWPSKSFDEVDMALNNQIDACACINKSVFQRIGLFDENRVIVGFEDWEYWIRLISSNATFYYIDDVLYNYRCRESSTLSLAWVKRNNAVDYIFSKKENKLLGVVRKLALENIMYRRPVSYKQLIQLFFKKIKSTFLKNWI
jgi:glycosyltransferase involved in cell wall biosynthesis